MEKREEQWLERIKADDESAFQDVYGQYWSGLYNAAYNHIRSREVAEEMVQDLFATFWLKRALITIHTSLQAYLYTALRHQIYDYFDKQAVRQRAYEQLAYLDADTSHITEQTVDYDALQERLCQAVEHLSQPTQTVFRLSRYEYLSIAEIAGQLNLSSKAVEYHLTKALKFLRGQLREFIAILLLVWFYV